MVMKRHPVDAANLLYWGYVDAAHPNADLNSAVNTMAESQAELPHFSCPYSQTQRQRDEQCDGRRPAIPRHAFDQIVELMT